MSGTKLLWYSLEYLDGPQFCWRHLSVFERTRAANPRHLSIRSATTDQRNRLTNNTLSGLWMGCNIFFLIRRRALLTFTCWYSGEFAGPVPIELAR